MADNLELQGGTWHVRLAVPKDVQKAFGGRRILSRSLGTGSRREALTLRLPILTTWKAEIKAARMGTPLPEGWQDTIVQTLGAFGDAFKNRKLALIGEAPTAVSAFAGDVDPLLVSALDSVADPSQSWGSLETQLKVLRNAEQIVPSLIPAIITAHRNLPLNQIHELQEIVGAPAAHKFRSAITTARLKAFREFREGQKGAPKHVDQQIGRMERLSKFLKEKSLPLDFDSVAAWIRSIDRAPATLNQHLLSGSAFWAWAIKYDPGFRAEYKDKADPFKAHDVPKGGGRETSGEQREAYTTTQLETLYKGAKDAGNQSLADLILLGAYTGCRIEQLCQLRVEHIIKEDGVPSFNFLGGKNRAAKRIVPIHPAILALVDHLIADSQDGFLIPASSENRYGKRSHALSKSFGYLKKKQGFGPLHVFHSMRNTAITAMVRANVPDHVVMEILGHATGTETHDTYSHGASAKQKLRAVSKLPTLRVD